LGWSLQPVVTMLRDWGDAHLAGPGGPPATYRHTCGETLAPQVVCRHCGGDAGPQTVRLAAETDE
jgi:hypothetical protein